MNTKIVGTQTIRESIYSGAINGIMAWTVYAVVEYWFSSILPWIIKPGYAYVPWHWGVTVMLFVLYPIFGLILGGLSGFCIYALGRKIRLFQKTNLTIFFSAMATSTVVLAFAINLVIQMRLGVSVSALLLISLLLIFVLALSTGSEIWSRRLRFITNSWTTIILLLGLSWLTLELFDSRFTVGVSALTYIIAVLLTSFFLQKITDRRHIDKFAVTVPASPIKPLTYYTLALLITFGISLFAKQTPLQVTTTVKPLPQDANNPNVILITMDTVRADHLSLYGYERNTTPNLRKFSKEATLYTHAIASGDMTLPTHASIFTGMYANRHKAHLDPWSGLPMGRPLSDKFNTIAEVLSGKGYLTMGVIANGGYVTSQFGMAQGFQYYDQRMPVLFFRSPQKFYFRKTVSNVISSVFPPDHDWIPRKAGEINKEIYTLLDKVKKDDVRFFFFINYMDAHWPYTPPPLFDTLFTGKCETFTSARKSTLVQEVTKLERKVTEEEYNHLVSQYDGGIAYVDFHIGQLIEQLKELKLYENTLIIITSDHGEVFGERNLIMHGKSVYQDLVHIPLIIKYPNINERRVFNELVSVIDLFPTVLDVMRYEIPKDVQGQNLLKFEPGNPRSVISETFPSGLLLRMHPRFNRIERAIFSWPYKFISSTAGKRELYDLSKDPNEKENLYKEEEEISVKLETKLKKWLEMTVPEFEPPTKVELDKDTRGRLKALGYIQ